MQSDKELNASQGQGRNYLTMRLTFPIYFFTSCLCKYYDRMLCILVWKTLLYLIADYSQIYIKYHQDEEARPVMERPMEKINQQTEEGNTSAVISNKSIYA